MRTYLKILIPAGAILVIAFSNPCRRDSHQRSGDPSVAVLPFSHLSNDSATVPFILGLREQLLNDLLNLGGYRVISRISSDLYTDANQAVTKIGRELHADFVIRGSVAVRDTLIELQVQAIRTSDERKIWSHTFTGRFIHPFDLQQSYAGDISREVDRCIRVSRAGSVKN